MSGPQTPGAEGAPGAIALDTEERELIRSLILADPELVLSDDMVMRALLGATAKGARNIVDLRDKLVERLESRLSKLVHANRSVIAAAYENVAGTQQVHRAVLALIDAPDAAEFLRRLTRDVPAMVGVEEARLCLEAQVDDIRPASSLADGLDGRVLLVPEATVGEYLMLEGDTSPGHVVLRPCGIEAEIVFGNGTRARSEALLRLNLGGSTGLLAFAAQDPDHFGPDQGVDLLTFFGGVVERLAARHLSQYLVAADAE
ncbi:MAG TPA: DUF484 family protein [Thermohalobaculum sp.]|nr:DUF484 family protein [Thermohalobaculum sp.]